MNKKLIVAIIVFAVIIYTQITIFVVQPIGSVPEGRTLIILKLNKTNFIDSADAMCEREMGKVSLMCRGIMLGTVMDKTKILFRLPYSEFLYKISTGGNTYSR
ncbi:hypothetical protein N5T78_07855 [Aliarcobacter cryaerophilus]|uniref:hypothetical protein n=1 Tax=Aliarcobacter cryaerophilus TaxID=28198 RepID=UPI0021B50089|nr:hypothetical protein [Aliarcobacter cryaerophilus]MCT7466487.1 hypothetical protein [Aliarcobacter cryaerophilus]